ncbi:MAG: hypothetical protein VB138_10670 [Burkholderia sp.]
MTNLVIAAHRQGLRVVLEALYVNQITRPKTCGLTEVELVEQFGPEVEAILCDLSERGYVARSQTACWITLAGRDYFDATDRE